METSWTSSVRTASEARPSTTNSDHTDRDAEEGNAAAELEEAPRQLGLLIYLHNAMQHLRRRIRTLYFASKDRDLPWPAQLAARLALSYAFSPIKIIPAAIPILGLVGQCVILASLVWLSVKLIPVSVMERAEAREAAAPLLLQQISYPGAGIVFVLWDASAIAGMYLLCVQLGNTWVQGNWPALAVPLAAMLFIAQALWMRNHMRTRKAHHMADDSRAEETEHLPSDASVQHQA